jgi:hypothetical protein
MTEAIGGNGQVRPIPTRDAGTCNGCALHGTAPRFIRVFCSLSTLNLVVDLEDRIGNETVAVWHLDFWQAVLVELSIREQDFVQA